VRWLALGLAFSASAGCAEPTAVPMSVAGDVTTELAFSTYLGRGSSTLRTAGFDGAGNVIVSGGIEGGEWPGLDRRLGTGGDWDVAVAKFSPQGVLLWGRVFGGPDEDYAYVSSVHENGDVVIGGRAGVGFPVSEGAADASFGGGVVGRVHGATDGFLMRLSPDGELRWATYIGGSGNEITRSIHWLSDGAIAVGGGNSRSRDLATDVGTLPGPVLKPSAGGELEAWVAVVAGDGASFDFVTYFGPDDEGGQRDETLRALAEDANGDLWLAGTSRGRSMPSTANALQRERRDPVGESSGWVARLSRDGRELLYFSWLGGAGHDLIETEGTSDAQGRFFVAGSTSSPDFPPSGTVYAPPPNNKMDAWVARIEPDGSLGFSARYGGTANDRFMGPGLAPNGSVVGATGTGSEETPTSIDAARRILGGRQDGGFAVFGPDGRLRYASLFGGSAFDTTRFAAFSKDGARCVLVGDTESSDVPLRAAAQSEPGGVYVAVFELVWPMEDDLETGAE
jgi:hypothetical protein